MATERAGAKVSAAARSDVWFGMRRGNVPALDREWKLDEELHQGAAPGGYPPGATSFGAVDPASYQNVPRALCHQLRAFLLLRDVG